jgi:hypothetical protein
MKKLFPFWTIVLLVPLAAGSAFAQAQYLINGTNPLDLHLETVPPNDCTYVTIIIDPSDVITTPLVQAGFWLAYDPTQASIGEVVIYDWNHGGPWDPGWTVLIPPDPLVGYFWIVVGNIDTVPVDAPIPICDVELCCEGPGQSQISVSTIPGFDTVLGDNQTVWDSAITNGIIDLWQIAPACSCDLEGPAVVEISAYDTAIEQYIAIPGPYCVNPPVYLWSDDCELADIDQTGLLTIPATTDSETCTIWAVDTANTDINTRELVQCSFPIELVPG